MVEQSRKVKERKKKTVLSDGSIQRTNDSSITSKRSVEKLYYRKNTSGKSLEFFRHFVPKFQRRSPIINRGYWTRMEAIKGVITQFIQKPSTSTKVIVNLGCGFDPYPFQLLADGVKDVVFLDVDYGDLMDKKVDTILRTDLRNTIGEVVRVGPKAEPELTNALPKDDSKSQSTPQKPLNKAKYPSAVVNLQTARYVALSCDLRCLSAFREALDSLFILVNTIFLFTAEVSITYMDQTSADNLIEWASKLPMAEFALLEQIMPASREHPFASTMLKHFNSLGTPLHSIASYPTIDHQRNRFESRGWSAVRVKNLLDFWNDDIPSSEKGFVESVEDFDEWEDFILFCHHYFILHASNYETMNDSSEISQPSYKAPTALCNVSVEPVARSVEVPIKAVQRKFSAGCRYDKNTLLQHGGLTTSRTSSSIFISASTVDPCIAPNPIESRVCHTLTRLDSGPLLLVGGRTSPRSALRDCWLLRNRSWSRVQDLPEGRYRHSCVNIGGDRVLLFGGVEEGKGASWLLWAENEGWKELKGTMSPRRSAALAWNVKTNSGVLIGGMESEKVLSDCFQVSVSGESVETRLYSNDRLLNRYGAKCMFLSDGCVILAGGVSSLKLLNHSDTIVQIDLISKLIRPIVLDREVLLTGFNMDFLGDDVLFYGGGAVCFSFGSYWAPVIAVDLMGKRKLLNLSKSLHATVEDKTKRSRGTSERSFLTEIPFISVASVEQFKELCQNEKPFIMSGQDIGPCTRLWKDPQYLIHMVGADREIVAHVSQLNSLHFAAKNFEYQAMPFEKFVHYMFSPTAHVYLRSLSSEKPKDKPAHFVTDFPSLAKDFHLPSYLGCVAENHFSSPLRLSSSNTSVWLHYDVMANILCQVVGKKRVRMYPPSDVNRLSFPAGGSSSTIENIFEKDPIFDTHPTDIVMNPGDIIYIPAMWLHATCTVTESISINFFWKNLDKKFYSAGRDIYGNSDIDAYQKGRKAVEKIKESFSGVPDDIREFYLQRLAKELAD